MDLSKLKWVVIIVVVVGGAWLFTQGGIDYIYDSSTANLPGNDPEQDVLDEAKLSKWGGFLLSTFRYAQAKSFYIAAIERYGPEGKNYYWNVYQLARCHEKLNDFRSSVKLLDLLHRVDGDAFDERVPDKATLRLRILKLVEMHELFDMNISV